MKRLSCAAFQELLSAALDDELSPAERIRLAEHLVECPRCRLLQCRLARLEKSFAELLEVCPPWRASWWAN